MTARVRGPTGPVGPVLYGLLFCVGVPALLVAWARATAAAVTLPALRSRPAGLAIAALGAALLLAGVAALVVHGRGLPMNAYPPPLLVSRGVYRLLPHPIYTGFCALAVGTSIAAGSASGLWLVCPVLVLACAALVWGYEREDLTRRFGPDRPAALLRLAPGTVDPPRAGDRVSAYVLVLIPWVVLYEAVSFLGVPRDARDATLPFERPLPVLEWTEVLYASTYLVVALAPLAARTSRDLRVFVLRGCVAMAVVFPLFLTIPFIAAPRPFTPAGPLGRLLMLERSLDTPAAAFPSFHVVWALVAAEAYASRWRRARWLFRAWAGGIAVSCVTTGMHALVDVAAGLGAGALVLGAARVWELLRADSERLANSWREWRLGRVRVINHGAYAGAGSAVGLLIAGTFAGPGREAPILLAALAGLVGAALWAQVIEGSPMLLRPYGYYGSIVGVLLGCLAAPLFGTSPWLVLAAFAVAGPWIQSGGRLRCLVQGCCHGREAPAAVGIRYRHPRSRVTRLAHLAEVPLHPTPLYSILWNLFIALVLARLWGAHAALNVIAGLYLILAGLGRFVEESYRGEPQTPIVAGLRLYQWVAIGSLLIGVAMTVAPGVSAAPVPRFSAGALAAAVGFGLLATAALGVDFPESERRFSRLA